MGSITARERAEIMLVHLPVHPAMLPENDPVRLVHDLLYEEGSLYECEECQELDERVNELQCELDNLTDESDGQGELLKAISEELGLAGDDEDSIVSGDAIIAAILELKAKAGSA